MRRRSSSPDPRRRLAVAAILLAVGLVAVFNHWSRSRYTPSTGPAYNLLLGNPSQATSDPAKSDNFLMVKPYFALSYNNSTGQPNWVSWRLTLEDLGNAPRKGEFDSDNTLPADFQIVSEHDYTGSGFDKGHLCPHGDRTANNEMSFATFVMTNIIPQAPNVNRKAWAQLEVYCRELVRSGHHLYIVAGPDGQGGRGSHGLVQSLHNGQIRVPAGCWKIVVVLNDEAGDDLARISPATRVIAVEMPNDNDAVGEEWAPFRTSVGRIEQRTGLKFFDKVNPDVARTLENKVDDQYVPAPRPLGHGNQD